MVYLNLLIVLNLPLCVAGNYKLPRQRPLAYFPKSPTAVALCKTVARASIASQSLNISSKSRAAVVGPNGIGSRVTAQRSTLKLSLKPPQALTSVDALVQSSRPAIGNVVASMFGMPELPCMPSTIIIKVTATIAGMVHLIFLMWRLVIIVAVNNSLVSNLIMFCRVSLHRNKNYGFNLFLKLIIIVASTILQFELGPYSYICGHPPT